MFDVVLRLIGGIVRFQRHAIVAHPIRTVLAESGITALRYFSISRSPVGVYWVFLYGFPMAMGRLWDRGRWLAGCEIRRRIGWRRRRLHVIAYKYQITVSKISCQNITLRLVMRRTSIQGIAMFGP